MSTEEQSKEIEKPEVPSTLDKKPTYIRKNPWKVKEEELREAKRKEEEALRLEEEEKQRKLKEKKRWKPPKKVDAPVISPMGWKKANNNSTIKRKPKPKPKVVAKKKKKSIKEKPETIEKEEPKEKEKVVVKSSKLKRFESNAVKEARALVQSSKSFEPTSNSTLSRKDNNVVEKTKKKKNFGNLHGMLNKAFGLASTDEEKKPEPVEVPKGGIANNPKFAGMHAKLQKQLGGGGSASAAKDGKPKDAPKKLKQGLASKLMAKLGKKKKLKIYAANAPEYEKYTKMQKNGLPEGAIRNCLERDGVDPEGFYNPSASNSAAISSSAAPQIDLNIPLDTTARVAVPQVTIEQMFPQQQQPQQQQSLVDNNAFSFQMPPQPQPQQPQNQMPMQMMTPQQMAMNLSMMNLTPQQYQQQIMIYQQQYQFFMQQQQQLQMQMMPAQLPQQVQQPMMMPLPLPIQQQPMQQQQHPQMVQPVTILPSQPIQQVQQMPRMPPNQPPPQQQQMLGQRLIRSTSNLRSNSNLRRGRGVFDDQSSVGMTPHEPNMPPPIRQSTNSTLTRNGNGNGQLQQQQQLRTTDGSSAKRFPIPDEGDEDDDQFEMDMESLMVSAKGSTNSRRNLKSYRTFDVESEDVEQLYASRKKLMQTKKRNKKEKKAKKKKNKNGGIMNTLARRGRKKKKNKRIDSAYSSGTVDRKKHMEPRSLRNRQSNKSGNIESFTEVDMSTLKRQRERERQEFALASQQEKASLRQLSARATEFLKPSEKQKIMTSNWSVEFSDEYERPFYVNKKTGESSWSPPEEFL